MFFIPFVVPDPPLPSRIPVPLRAYPAIPSISKAAAQPGFPVKKCGEPENPSSPPLPASLAAAKQWQYKFHFEHEYVAQDEVVAELDYNITSFTSLQLTDDVAPWLVAFQRKYMELASSALSDPKALELLIVLCEGVAATIGTSVESFLASTSDRFSITTSITSTTPSYDERIVRIAASTPSSCSADRVRICPRESDCVIVQEDGSIPLAYSVDYRSSQTHLARDLTFGFEDITKVTSVWGGISVRRNAAILGTDPVNVQFVYETPVARFGSPSTPLLSESRLIDIAATGQIGPLKQHLVRLFQAIFPDPISSDRDLSVRLRTLFVFNHREPDQDPRTRVPAPISFWPSYPIDSTTLPALIDDMAAKILSWRMDNPVRDGGFLFDFTLFAQTGSGRLPVLRLSQLLLRASQITDPLAFSKRPSLRSWSR